MESVVLFDNQEVKVKTDKGVTMINLVHTARCCGLIRQRKNNVVIRWEDIRSKLKSICSSVGSSTPQYVDEIKYILNEIDETDDRNSLYMSSWLSKRLAMECHSDKAMEYKNFLATLDENRENGLLTNENSKELMQVVTNTMNAIIPNMVSEIAKQFAPIVNESKEQVNKMANMLHDQSVIYDQEREELKSMIGLRSVNVKMLTNVLKEKLSEKFGFNVNAKDYEYIKYKTKVLNHYKVSRWEEIPVNKTNEVHAYMDTLLDE